MERKDEEKPRFVDQGEKLRIALDDSRDSKIHFVLGYPDEPYLAGITCCKLYPTLPTPQRPNGGDGRHISGKNLLDYFLSRHNFCLHRGWVITLYDYMNAKQGSDIWESNPSLGFPELGRDYLIMLKNLVDVTVYLFEQGFDIRTLNPQLIVFCMGPDGEVDYLNPHVMECFLAQAEGTKAEQSSLSMLAKIVEVLFMKGTEGTPAYRNPIMQSFMDCLHGRSARIFSSHVTDAVHLEREMRNHPLLLSCAKVSRYVETVSEQLLINPDVDASSLEIDRIVDPSGPQNWATSLLNGTGPSAVVQAWKNKTRWYNLDRVQDCVKFCRNGVSHVNDGVQDPNNITTRSMFGEGINILWPKLPSYLFETYGSLKDDEQE